MLNERYTEQRVNLYYDLYVPDGEPSRPRPLVVAFHGYEGNKESMMSLMRRVNSDDLIIASVQGPNSFFVRDEGEPDNSKIGFGWMMRYKAEETMRLHHETLRAVIRDTEAVHAIDRRAIFLVAFSQSVSLNYRFAFTNPGVVRGVIAVCGGIPGDWDQDKYKKTDTDVLIIAGDTDQFYPLERTRTFKNALASRARSVDFMNFPVGHVFPREALPLINEWIKTRIILD
jgi:predicted esterase